MADTDHPCDIANLPEAMGKPCPGYEAMRARAEAAEAALKTAHYQVANMRGHRVQCYWDGDDREEGHIDISDILDARDWGGVAEVEHVAIVATTFEAQLPPANDSDTDDLFEVCEPTREAAEAKVKAEQDRRAALAETEEE